MPSNQWATGTNPVLRGCIFTPKIGLMSRNSMVYTVDVELDGCIYAISVVPIPDI